MLDAIAWAEGTDNDADGGYGRVVRGTVLRAPNNPQLVGQSNVTITNFASHPNILVQVRPGLSSTAAGRYQFLNGTWTGLNLTDFGAANQDLGVVILLRQAGTINLLLTGNVSTAASNANGIWAAFQILHTVSRRRQWQQPIIMPLPLVKIGQGDVGIEKGGELVGEFPERAHLLSGLSLELVTLRPDGASHSIYEELWHLVGYQQSIIEPGEPAGEFYPSAAAALGQAPERLTVEVEPGVALADELNSVAVHNAYHFGKIVAATADRRVAAHRRVRRDVTAGTQPRPNPTAPCRPPLTKCLAC